MGTTQYFRLLPVERGMRFIGAVVGVPGGCIDLLFEDARGALLGDEVKTGRSFGAHEAHKLDQQVTNTLIGADIRFGDRFTGMRAVVLSRPQKSFLMTLDGDVLPLFPHPKEVTA